MLRILLIRHGQTNWNAGAPSGEHFRGRIDVGLNDSGLAQAEAVADRLASLGVHAVYASPLLRAMDTARPIAERHSLLVVPWQGLLDIDYGQWSGRSHDEVAAAWPTLYRLWRTLPDQVHIPGGECLEDVRQRFDLGLGELLARHENQVVVLVGHQAVNKVAVASLLGLGLGAFWRIRQDTGCINRFDHDGQAATVLTLNEVDHLPVRPPALDELAPG
ncbi:MAG: histidine phosphatase family protein [Anaerolineae bacterium]|nr:histidine phosphatase family protein [Anaerolineae bacterium]